MLRQRQFRESEGGENMTVTEIIITLVVAILGSSALATFVQVNVQRHYAKKDEAKSVNSTVKFVLEALAHNAFFSDCRRLMPKEAITEDELDNHNYLYKAYHSLGLNSTGDRMHEIILEKPVLPNK